MTVQTTAPWYGALAHPAQAFEATSLPVLSGQLPTGLRGSLYRNGPARMERGGDRVGHWFDGDGAILGLHFKGAEATGLYRFVETEGLHEEEKAGRLLFSGYGTRARSMKWARRGPKNPGNTSVVAVQDKLLALWEGGLPHALDLQTLETRGLDTLEGLTPSDHYSAHPKTDPDNGDVYNFGIEYGRRAVIHLYRSDRTGRIVQRGKFLMNELPMVHDFVMAGPWLVFFVSPVRLNAIPMLAGLRSYSECLSWKPDKGTVVVVVDRRTLQEVARHTAESFYQWHFGNGAVTEDGTILVDVVRYEDFETNQALGEIGSAPPRAASLGRLYRIRGVAPGTAAIVSMEQVLENSCEFPEVASDDTGRPWRHTWLLLHEKGRTLQQDWFSTVGRFDHQTGQVETADLGGRYPMEPIHAPDVDHPGQSYLITVVYDSGVHKSEVWIFDAHRLAAGPLCRLGLPQVVPIGFHGTFRSAT